MDQQYLTEQMKRLAEKMSSGKDLDEVQRTLRDLLVTCTGGKLYKYRSFQTDRKTSRCYALENLADNTLFCAAPSQFNDPFDCKIGIDFQSLYRALFEEVAEKFDSLFEWYCGLNTNGISFDNLSYTDKRIIEFWKNDRNLNACLTHLDYLKKNNATIQTINVDTLKQIMYVVMVGFIKPMTIDPVIGKYIPVFELSLPKYIERFNINSFSRTDFNTVDYKKMANAIGIECGGDEIDLVLQMCKKISPDSYTKAINIESKLNELLKRGCDAIDNTIHVGCLSSEYDNMLLWSHYADNHSGFCIEYDFSEATEDLIPFPVIYSLERPVFPWKAVIQRTPNTFKEAMRIFLSTMITKDNKWAYEKEWRILTHASDLNIIHMPRISAVYLGCKCSPEDEKKIREIIKDQASVRKMKMDRGIYRLYAEGVTI